MIQISRVTSIYIGEFVIANQLVYLIQPDGEVIEVAERRELFEAE